MISRQVSNSYWGLETVIPQQQQQRQQLVHVMSNVRNKIVTRQWYDHQCVMLLRLTVLMMIPRYCLCLAGEPPGIKLRTVTIHRDRTDFPAYSAVVGGEVALPCNVTPPTYDDGVSLILWYRDDTGNPIYTVDARTTHLDNAKHFSTSDILGNRGVFNITYPMSYMRIKPVKANDGGEYRCRVDFRRARTINRILKLNVIVPATKVVIYDNAGNRISDIAGPFNEDSSVNLTCDSEGGNPPPVVKWWRGSALVDESYFTTPKGIIRNVITLAKLTRDDLMMVLTCQASNTNLTVPASQTIAVDLNLKPKEVRVITAMHNMSAGEKVELVCQSSGSRPPAKIIWWKGNTEMEHIGESTSDDGSVTTNFLAFVPSVEDNGKSLSCSAFNPQFPEFQLQDGWTMNVLYAPLLSLILGASIQHQEILEGSDVYFECNIQANPQVSEIGWLLNNERLSADTTLTTLGIQVLNNSLLIRNVGKTHRGKYQCFAVNSEGRGESEVVTLKIQYAPICKSVQRVHYGVAIHEEAKIECEVDADPSDVVFHWGFNNTADESLDIISFTSDGKKSVARYTPRVDLDYGVLYCWGRNSAGKQREPCVFFVIEAGPPDPPDNCTITNITAHTLTIECLPGYSGGLDQNFYLEVYSSNPNRLLSNISSSEYPFFIVYGLPAGYTFRLVAYSNNSKGKSRSISFIGSTLIAAHWQSDDLEPIVISPVLAILMGIVGALILLAIIIIMIMKIKSEDDLKSSEKLAINSINRWSKKKQNSVSHRKLYTVDENCPDIILSEILMNSKENFIDRDTALISDDMRSKNAVSMITSIPPPDCFHDRYSPNFSAQLMDTNCDISSPSPSTSTNTNSDPLRLLCNVKHNHIIKDSKELTYTEIILPNDQQLTCHHTNNIIGMNNITNYSEIEFKHQLGSMSPHVCLLSAKMDRISPSSRKSGLDSDDDDISIMTINTPIKALNKTDNNSWVIIENDGSHYPTAV